VEGEVWVAWEKRNEAEEKWGHVAELLSLEKWPPGNAYGAVSFQ
jgi:hypothetical protein